MLRLLFQKSGNAVWISHLDLMRVFQRAFKRAKLPLTHTQGFNPRASVSIALPLSVGIESDCELLDFELETDTFSCDEICQRLNEALPAGVAALQVYDSERKLKHLAYARYVLTLEYDNGVSTDLASEIEKLFTVESLIVPKKSKNGVVEQDVIPLIKEMVIKNHDLNTLKMNVLVCCQNPVLNPTQIIAAISLQRPELKPDFASCKRLEIFDEEYNVFR